MKSFADPFEVDFLNLDIDKYFSKLLEITFIENDSIQRFTKYENIISKRIEDIEIKFSLSPLSNEKFYYDLGIELKSFEFEYLEEIIDGEKISNLENDKIFNEFLFEVVQIKIITYIEERLKNKVSAKPLIQPLQWNGKINTLATLFLLLHKAKIVNGSKENLKRMLLNDFQINGEPLSPSYLKDILDENKFKYDKNTIEILKPFISYLTENIPKQ